MKIIDALNLLGFVEGDEINLKSVKTAYRRACQKYHPDKGGSVHMMQSINQAFDTLKTVDLGSYSYDFSDTNVEYPDMLNEAINQVIDLPGVVIEVCGNWVWLTGNTKPHKDVLGKNGAGFFYAKKKQAWYFRPANWKSSSKGSMDLDDIRDKYGSVNVKNAHKANKALENRYG